MIKVQCINQHWFDAEKYTLCPHCGAEKSEEKKAENPTAKEPQRKTLGNFLFGNRETETSAIQRSTVQPSVKRTGQTQWPPQNDMASRRDVDIPKTELLMKTKTEQPEVVPMFQNNYMISYVFSDEIKVPVAAWLVGISGMRAGRSFVVKPGVNRLVNAVGNSATITYEPTTRRFLITGEDTEVYCNGFRVGSTRELNAYDVLEIENEKYMFVPFCGANFDWNNINN